MATSTVSTESTLLAFVVASEVKIAANQNAATVDPRAALIFAPVAIIVVIAAPERGVSGGAAFPTATVPFAIVPLATAAIIEIPAVSVATGSACIAIPETLTITVSFNVVATVWAITSTIRFGVTVGKGSQLFSFGKDSSERHSSGRGARQGGGGGTEEDGNGR